jgi:hypothetical protein
MLQSRPVETESQAKTLLAQLSKLITMRLGQTAKHGLQLGDQVALITTPAGEQSAWNIEHSASRVGCVSVTKLAFRQKLAFQDLRIVYYHQLGHMCPAHSFSYNSFTTSYLPW